MKTAICLTLLCLAVGAYCTGAADNIFRKAINGIHKRQSCLDPSSFVPTGCQASDVTDEFLCLNCCQGTLRYLLECSADQDEAQMAADANESYCKSQYGVCGGGAAFNIIAASTVMLLAKFAYVLT